MTTGYLRRCEISTNDNSSHPWRVNIEWWTKAQDGSFLSLPHANPDTSKPWPKMVGAVSLSFKTKEDAVACLADRLAATVEVA